MTMDYEELMRLALNARASGSKRSVEHLLANDLFSAKATPSTIIALLEENKRLREENTALSNEIQQHT